MSYDLVFWCDPRPAERDTQAVYEALIEGQQVDGLQPFRSAESLAALALKFPGRETPDADGARYAVWERSDGSAIIEFAWSPQHLVATARGSVTNDEMNSVIDVCVDVGGGRLFDPQTGERFDSV